MSYIGQGLPADVFSGFTIDKFTGDGTANKALTLSKAPFSETTVLVTIDGVVQEPTDDFTVSGTTLTLVGTAANGSEINVTHLSGTVPSTLASKVDLNGVSDTLILDADADTTISADTDDQIDFKVGGADKVSITSSQAKFTQTGDTDVFVIESTSATAETSPDLVLFRNSSSPADDDTGGNIIFRGRNDNSQDVDYASITGAMSDVSDSSEDGKLEFAMMLAGTSREYMKFNAFPDGGSETVFNDGQVDINFRVESDGNANIFKVDAGSDFVIFGGDTRSSDAIFNVTSSANAKTLEFDNTHASMAQDMIRIDCTRSGSSSYNFLRMMSGNSSDTEFVMSGEGSMNADGTFNANGADYAEFFETNDGSAIEVGKTVVLDGNKVRASTSSDDAATVIGVVRPKVDGINSMMIGNTAWNSWTNKYMHDDYGRFVMEDYTVTEWVVKTYEDGTQKTESYDTDKIPSDVTVPSDAVVKTQQRKKLNSDYDKSKEYKPRSERDEWVIIGMLGQIQITKGQKTGTNWIKMRDISDTVEEWLVR